MVLPAPILDVRLLDFLKSNGYLSEEQLSAVKLEVSKSGGSEIDVIVKLGLMSPKEVYRAKAKLYRIDFISDLSLVTISEDLMAQIDIKAVMNQGAFPFEVSDNYVKILMADPFNSIYIQYWKLKFPGKKIQVYTAVPSEVIEYINTKFGGLSDESISEAVTSVRQQTYTVQKSELKEITEEIGKDLKNAPVAKIANSILFYGARVGASDVHIEPLEKRIRVRYRIDGVMIEKMSLPSEILPPLSARFKIMSDLKIDETRLPQDGRIPMEVDNKMFDLRVSTLPSIYGEKIVMRFLERTMDIPSLEDSGLRGDSYRRYIDAIGLTNGIILITGPTGSGKTRTLASTLARLNRPEVNIITIENPVEIRINGITQVQIHHEIGLDFARVLRAVLRQDPDIIMVGEIRDRETADLAIRAALTGHLVLSTLHTNDAVSALPRLIDMGIEPYLVGSTVKVVVAQRLVRTICPNCRVPYLADNTIIEEINRNLDVEGFDLRQYIKALSQRNVATDVNSKEFMKAPPVKMYEITDDGREQFYLYKGTGCEKCNNKGYKGRTAIFEVATITENITRAVIKRETSESIARIAKEEGMLSMVQDGLLKVLEGITTMEEVMRVAKAE